MSIKVGDMVRVVKVAGEYDEYEVGDLFVVKSFFDKDEDIIIAEDGTELYSWEVELYIDEAKAAADDADVGEWVAPEDSDTYKEIVTSLSQAIADKAAQMRGDADGWPPKELRLDGAHGKQTEGKRANDEPSFKTPIPNHVVYAPAHYVNSGIQPIEYMADKLPGYGDGHTAYCVGNVIKYVSRAPHKGKLIEDLRKARQYLDFAIEHEEKKGE